METSFEDMPDDQLIAVATWKLPDDHRRELVELVETHHERELTHSERTRLDSLMQSYRRSLVLKAQALQVAVERGLLSQSE